MAQKRGIINTPQKGEWPRKNEKKEENARKNAGGGETAPKEGFAVLPSRFRLGDFFPIFKKLNQRNFLNLEAEGTQEPRKSTQLPVTTRAGVTQRGWGSKGPIVFLSDQDRQRRRPKRMENEPLHEASQRRKETRDCEKWRIAPLNINGITNTQRTHRLESELHEKRKDLATLRETLYRDAPDKLRDFAIINSGAIRTARKRKWGASIALRKAIIPHVEEIERRKGILTLAKNRKNRNSFMGSIHFMPSNQCLRPKQPNRCRRSAG